MRLKNIICKLLDHNMIWSDDIRCKRCGATLDEIQGVKKPKYAFENSQLLTLHLYRMPISYRFKLIAAGLFARNLELELEGNEIPSSTK